jgi:tetratricopeptide (TPR) repeat protein
METILQKSALELVKQTDFFYRSANWTEVLKLCRRAIQIDGNCIPAFMRIGEVYLGAADFGQARSYFIQALVISQTEGMREQAAKAHNALGNTCMAKKSFDEALNQYYLALGVVNENDFPKLVSILEGNVGLALRKKNQLKEAKVRYKKALKIARRIGDKSCEMNILWNLSSLLYEEGKVFQSSRLLDEYEILHRELLTKHPELKNAHSGNAPIRDPDAPPSKQKP